VLVNITGGCDLGMHEIAEAVSIVENATGSEVNLIHGVVCREEPCEDIMITVVATGFSQNQSQSFLRHEDKIANIKPGAIKIPFNGNKETSQSFNKPSVLFGGKSHFPVENSNSGNGNGMQPKPIITPKGDKDLKNYDIPAFERRPLRESFQNLGGGFNPMNKFSEPVETAEITEQTETTYENLEKPAFLRKIMD